MPLRMAITRQTANNEQMVTDVCQWNPVTGDICHDIPEVISMMEEGLQLADDRLLEMQVRMLEGYELRKYFTPDVWSKVLAILEIINGKQNPEAVVRRWHSEVEETQELEQARLDAAIANGQDAPLYMQQSGHTYNKAMESEND